jgi:hypothetical protein
MNSYPINTAINLTGQFSDGSTGIPADPSAVTLRVLDSTNRGATYAGTVIVRIGVGSYSYLIIPTVPGIWRYRWEGRGGVTAANEGRFEVRPSSFSEITPFSVGSSAGQARCVGVS